MRPAMDDIPADGAKDTNEIYHLSWLETWVDTSDGPDTKYFLWECGDEGNMWNDTTGPWSDSSADPLLQQCRDGLLVSCRTALDLDSSSLSTNTAVLDAALKECGEDVTVNGQSPFSSGSKFFQANAYCATEGDYCAVCKSASCCGDNYRGLRPFESVEARAIRELVNNVGFSYILDLHAAADNLTYSCTYGQGCKSTDYAYKIADRLLDELTAEYNRGIQVMWNEDPVEAGVQMYDYLELRRGGISAMGTGQLPAWAASAVNAISDNYFLIKAPNIGNPTKSNFDVDTLRAIPALNWELGLPGFETPQINYGKIVSCDATSSSNVSSKARSSWFIVNQLEGAKTMLTSLANHAVTPFHSSWSHDKDIQVLSLRITDENGRGVQQTEMRWDKVDEDPTGIIYIPAGKWFVAVDVIAGGEHGSADVAVTITVKDYKGKIVGPVTSPTPGSSTVNKTIPWGTRIAHKVPFTFAPLRITPGPGQAIPWGAGIYTIEAKAAPIGTTPNATKVNDNLISKVFARYCNQAGLPNGVTSDEFCKKGLPFDCPYYTCDRTLGICKKAFAPVHDATHSASSAAGSPSTCWSSGADDEYDALAGDIIKLKGDGVQVWTRNLVSSSSAQDRDIAFLSGRTGQDDRVNTEFLYSPKVLRLGIADLCGSESSAVGASIPGIEVYVDRITGPFGMASELKSWQPGVWKKPSFGQDLLIPLTSTEVTGYYNDTPLRIQIRNTPPEFASRSYRVSAVVTAPNTAVGGLSVDGANLYAVDVQDRVMVGNPLGGAAELSIQLPVKLAGSFNDLFFRPFGSLKEHTAIEAYDASNQPAGTGREFEGGLALALDELNPADGPFTVLVKNLSEPQSGEVYICPATADNCFDYDPGRDLCDPLCDGADRGCCLEPATAERTCENLAEDELNCGGCGIVCDFDETCVRGMCVRGSGTSCWNTECPDDTQCCGAGGFCGCGYEMSCDECYFDFGCESGGSAQQVSCLPVMADPKHCGFCGIECNANEVCSKGFCMPRSGEPCSTACADSEACCYNLGMQSCTDLQSDAQNCAACGRKCQLGEFCEDGRCVAWRDAQATCGTGYLNCGGFTCVNKMNDRNNCGSCGHVCPQDAWCEDGICAAKGRVGDVED